MAAPLPLAETAPVVPPESIALPEAPTPDAGTPQGPGAISQTGYQERIASIRRLREYQPRLF
jgi:hypothetical protein